MPEGKETPAASGEGFGFEEVPRELAEEVTEATTGEKPEEQATETVAPEEAGKTAVEEVGEEGQGVPDKFKDAEGKLDKDKLLKSYQELEKHSSQSDQRKAELEANNQAMAPLVEQAKRDAEEKLRPKKAELTPEQFREQYLETLASDPRKAQKMLLDTPEVREAVTQMVNEIARPFVDSQNKRAVKELYDKVGSEITVDNGYPVNFKEVQPEIEKLGERKPWLTEAAVVAVKAGEGESFLRYCYSLWLEENPDRLKGWEGKKPPTTPPVTETGSPSSPKGKETISEEEKTMREIEERGKEQSYLL